MKTSKAIWKDPRLYIAIGIALFIIAFFDIKVRQCTDDYWNCMSLIGKSCVVLFAIILIGGALFSFTMMIIGYLRKK